VDLVLAEGVPLAPLTTLELGGPAAFFFRAASLQELQACCRWAARRRLPMAVLGGGSNLVVADEGFPGLVVQLGWRELELSERGGKTVVVAGGGTAWQEVVDATVAAGLGGLACLSGIPGAAVTTPVQNVGAYGQEVAEQLLWVEAVHRPSGALLRLSKDRCTFGYRRSVFRKPRNPFILVRLAFALEAGEAVPIRYPELTQELARRGADPTPQQVAAAVLALRGRKGMLLDPADPEHRTVGSFFTNPLLSPRAWERLRRRVWRQGILPPGEDPPHFPAGSRVKVPAAWLVERAGFPKGLRRGPVGIASRHALALVHLGGGTTADLLALAKEIRTAVAATFGVALEPEPAFLGFPTPNPLV